MFFVKSKEIAELKKDCRRHDVVLDDITAAAQATREASDQVIQIWKLNRKRSTSCGTGIDHSGRLVVSSSCHIDMYELVPA